MVSLKLDLDGVLLNVVSAYAPQVGRDREEKEEFWEDLHETVELIPREERLIIGADFNGLADEGNSGDERVIGKYGHGARNDEGQAIADFGHHTDLPMINSFYSKCESHKVKCTRGGRRTQIDYILCRRVHLKESRDCKFIPGESVAKQHHVVTGEMKLTNRRRREVKTEPRIKWWRLRGKNKLWNGNKVLERSTGSKKAQELNLIVYEIEKSIQAPVEEGVILDVDGLRLKAGYQEQLEVI
ncbi:craniofacial development protein 2-like [Penaeus monodon]|uniref:craniofacial development protein 2-like n=1 Tax=Penaeus monodon TaxID=6687 RepID=UPI0018A6E937|nr:craniofacial development protein 2-like [Penaeus monodon]